jgi:iron-sulfur cluster repair protein YtfE (RIC family)
MNAMTANRDTQDAVWSFIEHEHLDLIRGINRIHEVASEIGTHAAPELSAHVLGVLRWMESMLEPHMAWEEAMLYPEIDRRAGTRWATRVARFDHHQIRDIAARLRNDQHELARRAGPDLHTDIRFDLAGLEALLRAHLEREERFLIPVLGDEDGSDQSGLTMLTPSESKVEAGNRA